VYEKDGETGFRRGNEKGRKKVENKFGGYEKRSTFAALKL
jgi:hypothetical protein